jgi:hypothetical protein
VTLALALIAATVLIVAAIGTSKRLRYVSRSYPIEGELVRRLAGYSFDALPLESATTCRNHPHIPALGVVYAQYIDRRIADDEPPFTWAACIECANPLTVAYTFAEIAKIRAEVTMVYRDNTE